MPRNYFTPPSKKFRNSWLKVALNEITSVGGSVETVVEDMLVNNHCSLSDTFTVIWWKFDACSSDGNCH